MSVASEFRRLLSRCIELLESSNAVASPAWANRLLSSRAVAMRDLTTAAERVLELDTGPDRIAKLELSTPSETEEFRERCEHMLSIARVIAGVRDG